MPNTTYAAIALFAISIPLAFADQGSFTNSGGSASGGAGISLSSNVANPEGTLTLACVGTTAAQCAGGNLNFASTDGTTVIKASFTSGTYAESCSGGGKGGHVTCGYGMTGYFSGALTVNGQTQAITGVTYQSFGTTNGIVDGSTIYNSAYAPFYYSDSGAILRSDDLKGTNQISYGTQGSDVGQFYGAFGIAVDSVGRIYVADTYNCRVVRIDDMNGTNWTSFGTCGAGQGQFYDPAGIAVDGMGRIYVVDSGNCRIVRMDDLNGTNWIAYGSPGNGIGQFSGVQSAAVDANGRLYVADAGNLRLVRIDDMYGSNLTIFSQTAPVNGVSHLLGSPTAVAIDAAGRIYVADAEGSQTAVIRMDDMTGANWTSFSTAASGNVNSIAVDAGGTVFLGGGGVQFVDGMSGALTSSGAIGPVGSYYVFGITSIPVPTPRPSAIGLTPATLNFSQNVGTTSPALPLTISNFGGAPLNVFSVSASGAFFESSNCPIPLPPGSNCTVSVTFAPTGLGPTSGTLTIVDDSGNLGGTQVVTLTGTGTAPAASVTPSSVTFNSQVVNSTSSARNVVLQNTGTGPMQVASVTAGAPFNETDNCLGTLAAGVSCTIAVTFTPTTLGTGSGTLTIQDDVGTQSVTLKGTGSGPVSLSTNSIEFSTTVVGSASAAQTVTLTNRGSVVVTFTSFSTNAPFGVASNTCAATLAVGANCTIGVTFTPTTSGTVNGTLTIADDAPTGPQTVSLTGNGTAPVTLSASLLNFSAVVGSTSAAKTVSLTNHLSGALTIASVVASAGFAVASNTCGASLAPGAACTVGVTFTPAALGAATGTLTFSDSSPDSPQSVTLTGTGNVAVTLSATSLNMGTVTVGSKSGVRTVTLTNHLSGALGVSSIVASTGFSVSSNTCGASVAAGASCSVGLTFTPTASGTISGTLTFTDSAGVQTLNLSGTGK